MWSFLAVVKLVCCYRADAKDCCRLHILNGYELACLLFEKPKNSKPKCFKWGLRIWSKKCINESFFTSYPQSSFETLGFRIEQLELSTTKIFLWHYVPWQLLFRKSYWVFNPKEWERFKFQDDKSNDKDSKCQNKISKTSQTVLLKYIIWVGQ